MDRAGVASFALRWPRLWTGQRQSICPIVRNLGLSHLEAQSRTRHGPGRVDVLEWAQGFIEFDHLSTGFSSEFECVFGGAREKEMGRIFVVELEGRTYRCKFCKTHLALVDDVVSRSFHCRRGKAYLFSSAVNITVGPHEERMMLSGMHTVADIFCCCCGQIVGWKYEAAHEKSQKYKEGKFVLERARILDGLDSEFYIDSRPSMSDGEDV
ncbi:hypothetical protein RJ640_004427 [Escallonia rubra]|uniref:Yippee domain-containing protein n=1 Tax=Escallonia rubra TaxID=112253 RepID=A0AA88QPA8_9ASTE|nr:hypothetical protein RJ640_004427 [Escallonia rubra]